MRAWGSRDGVRVRVALTVVAILAAFVFWHTGGRADAVCRRELFVPAGGLSLWPPGARCTYGEPATSDVLINPWLTGTLLLIAVVNVAITVWRSRRRSAASA